MTNLSIVTELDFVKKSMYKVLDASMQLYIQRTCDELEGVKTPVTH